MSLSAILLIALTTAAVAQQPGRGLNFYSVEKEIALGRQLAAEFEQRHLVVRDPEISEYLDRLGQKLASQPSPFTYSFGLVRADFLEPMALPGGFVFLSTRLIETADNEAQLAGMLAHSIGHIASRHGTRAATRGQIVNLGTVPLIFVSGGEQPGAVPLGFLPFARAFEHEADRFAVATMAQAGYDPAELARFIEQLPHVSNPALSTHPSPEQRIQAIQQQLTDLPPRPYEARTAAFSRIQALIARIQAP